MTQITAEATKQARFTFNGQGWLNSVLAGTGIALKPDNHPKLIAHAISLKIGSPSDLKKLSQPTLMDRVSATLIGE